jgi:phosphotransferase system enzyme I (PtsI)
MIIDALQLEKLCRAVREIAVTTEALSENILLGAMFEVPSACLQADKIFSQVDFASIGSNDLIQYLFAVDRNNELVSQDYDPEHPVLWDILKQLSAAGQRAGKYLSICGEMAGRNTIPAKLLALGITSFSVSPRLIPRVRNEIYNSLKSK